MKILIYTLALISAFFVSANEVEFVPAKQVNVPTSGFTESSFGYPPNYSSLDEAYDAIRGNVCVNSGYPDCIEQSREVREYAHSSTKTRYVYTVMWTHSGGQGLSNNLTLYAATQIDYVCPPDSHPNYTQLVNENQCSKPPPDPNEKCDEFGNNSMLPPKSGVGSEGQNACYTNPTTGLQCQYKQGSDNFIATGKTCDGDENDYGDKPTPEPLPDGADDNCYNYGSQGQVLICDVDPNEGCNPIIVSGQQQYQCPAGCGSMDGVYFCSYDDKDGDGIPDDKNGNGVPDNDETCENGKCTPNRPDDDTTPTPETPDMTQTNTRLDSVIGELDSIGGNIRKTNQTLDGINSGIQGIKQGQDKSNALLSGVEKNTKLTSENTDVIAGNTKGILDTLSETDVVNNFNPDSSSSFYESSYENGFTGIWEEKSVLFEQTETIQFLQQFKFNAGGSPPDTQICFNLGGTMDFGCAELPTPSPQLLAILKIFILITAAFLCRALIFGG